MKKLILITAIFAAACAPKKEKEIAPDITNRLSLIGTSFTAPRLVFENAVETSIVLQNNSPIHLVDLGMNANLSIGTNNGNLVTLDSDARFSYVFQHGNINYMFLNRGGSIFLFKASDLYSWVIMNGGQAVLSPEENSNYKNIWNVGAAIDDNGVWHLLIESSHAGNEVAGLTYATASLNGDYISFQNSKSANYVIPQAGNAWLGFVPGKGLVTVYGSITASGIWEIRAAVNENGTWVVNDTFLVGENGMHICDPHVLETSSGLLLAFSYDQKYIYELKAPLTLEQFFDEVK